MPAYLARTGLAVFAMLFTITFLTEHVADGRALLASANAAVDLPQLREIALARVARPELATVAGFESLPATVASPAEPPVAEVFVAAPQPVPVAAAAPAAPAAVALSSDAIVLASWYGPGFYGNRTACGQTYTPEILGVAHLTLPCGTRLTLTYGSRSITVTVIDRGPYVAGRAIDLSNATRIALGCTDLCTVRMQIGQ